MSEDPLDDVGSFDAGDDAQRAATHATAFDVDVEDALEAMHPAHGGSRRRPGLTGSLMSAVGDNEVAVLEVRGEHAVVSGEMGAGARHEGGESGDEVCRNPDQARKDAATREQILAALASKLRSDGPKSVVANKGYKRYLKAEKGAFAVDLDKARDEARFDGMWVLRTNTELTAVEIALRYKQLWMVEQIFRTAKSLLDTRPIFHKTDATICGHVFCSFLALVLRDELFRRMDNAGVTAEWDDILRDLNALSETAITYNGKTFVVRSNAVGVRLPNTVRQVDVEKEVADPSP